MISIAQIDDQHFLALLPDHHVGPDNNLQTESPIDTGLAENSLFQKVSPFYYKERARVTFQISDQFKNDFIMVKGLIEFHRPKDLLFTYDVHQRSVGVDVSRTQFAQLRQFLAFVYGSLMKEKQFRHALKIAIEFEARYRLEREGVYTILKRSISTQAQR